MLSQIEEQIRGELLKLMKHFQCPICLNLMSDPMVTRCVHHFCGQCIIKAIESSSGDHCRCPLCNEKITKRSLRSQIHVSDIITAFKEAVDLFEKDIKMSIIRDNDVVVFDVSTDRSSCCVDRSRTTDSMIDDINDTKNEIQNKKLNQTNESINVCTDIESNRHTINASDKTTDQTFGDNDEDMDITDIYFESTKTSINDKSNGSLNPIQSEEMNSVIDLNPTQSQNLRVNKSRITYSSSRPSTDDRFDRIIRLSESYANFNKKSKEDKNESRIETDSDFKHKQRKPLTQLNKLKNKKLEKNKKFKRVVNISDSSDDEFNPFPNQNKRKIIESDESESDNQIESKAIPEVNLICDDNSEDLFLPEIHKNNSIESIRNNNLGNESNSGYESDP